MKDDVPVSRSAQRVRLDSPRQPPIVKIDAKPVGCSEPDDFKVRLRLAGERKAQGPLADRLFTGRRDVGGGDPWCDPTLQPIEEDRQLIPERDERREDRQLMREHLVPVALENRSLRLETGESGQIHSLERALLTEHVEQHRRCGTRFRVAEEVDHVIQVPRPGTLGKGSHLFPERLFVGVRPDGDASLGLVAVGMEQA